LRIQAHGLFHHFVLNFVLWSFEFVSDFDIRYSDLSKYIDQKKWGALEEMLKNKEKGEAL